MSTIGGTRGWCRTETAVLSPGRVQIRREYVCLQVVERPKVLKTDVVGVVRMESLQSGTWGSSGGVGTEGPR